MFKIHFLLTIRHFRKQLFSSIINIVGLTLAVVTCLFIFLFVTDEFKYDQFHTKKERIIRLVKQDYVTGDKSALWPAIEFERFVGKVPQIETGFRLNKEYNALISRANKKFIHDFYFADNEIFDVMDFPLLQGDAGKALSNPYSVVITEDVSNKFFGEENPIGKVLNIENKYDLEVTGVLKNLPAHSHIKTNIIASISTLNTENPNVMNEYYIGSCFFYFLLDKNSTLDAFESSVSDIRKLGYPDSYAEEKKFVSQPLEEIYLYHHDTKWDFAEHGDVNTVISFISIALLIMLMAAFNFTNLLSTQVKFREKELMMRKLLGAGRKSILKQFFFETFFYLGIALAFSLLLVELFIGSFNQLTGKYLSISSILQWQVIISILGLLSFTALFSILYPSFITLKSNSFDRLKGSTYSSQIKLSNIKFGFRQFVTVLQFAITIALIFGTVIIFNQMTFISKAKLGFDKEHLLVIENPYGLGMYERYENYKNNISRHPGVKAVSASENIPGKFLSNIAHTWLSGESGEHRTPVNLIAIDYGLLNLLDVNFINGRDFSKDITSDQFNSIVITREAANVLGLTEPLGAKINGLHNSSDNQAVIGVVEDIHFKSFKEEISPIVFYLRQWSSSHIVVRVGGNNLASTMRSLEEEWNNLAPDRLFVYSFVDEIFDKLYTSEKRLSKLVIIFCGLAITISFIGLLSVISLVAQMRTKEIGIRKTLGASGLTVYRMMVREYIYIIIAANVIALPVAYYFLSKWLQQFVYRAEISAFAFVASVFLAFCVGLSAISFRIIKAAKANPVDSLRYE